MSKDWYTVNEVAVILGENYKKIYRLVASRELGSYRVGREYRIRVADLDAYFAKQDKQLHSTFAPFTNVTPSTHAMEVAVMDRGDKLAHAGQSAEEAPLRHTDPSGGILSRRVQEQMTSPAPTATTRPSQEPPTQTYANGGLGRETESTARSARQREAEYIEQFRGLFNKPLALPHPFTDDVLNIKQWSTVEEMHDDLHQLGRLLNVTILHDEQLGSFPHNVRLIYWVAPQSLGGLLRKYPKEGFVLECATLSRLERLTRTGVDAAKLGKADAERALKERLALMRRWSEQYGTPVAYVIGLASTTGWDAESIDYVQTYADDMHLIPYLIDLIELTVHKSQANGKGETYIEIFDLPLGDRKVRLVQQQVRELLLVAGALSDNDLQAQVGCSKALLRNACSDLVRNNADYEILRDESTFIIRSRL